MIPRVLALALAMPLGAALCGCAADENDGLVNLYGTMIVGPELGDPPLVLSGARLDAYDDAGELIAEGAEPWPDDSPGYYRIRDLEPGAHVHVVAWHEPAEDEDAADDEGDDDDSAADATPAETFVSTVHAAWMPPANLYAYDGELFILPLSWLELTLRYLTKGGLGRSAAEVVAPDVEDSGGMILGSLADPERREGTRVIVRPLGGKPQDALYLDELGVAREALTGTGPGGGFALFDLPAGPAYVQVELVDGSRLPSAVVLVVEDGCTVMFDTEIRP